MTKHNLPSGMTEDDLIPFTDIVVGILNEQYQRKVGQDSFYTGIETERRIYETETNWAQASLSFSLLICSAKRYISNENYITQNDLDNAMRSTIASYTPINQDQ